MKKKSDKEKDLEALKKDFEKINNIFLTGFEKLTVQQDFELRKTVRGAGANYRVVKNNLAEKAAAGTPAEGIVANGSLGQKITPQVVSDSAPLAVEQEAIKT